MPKLLREHNRNSQIKYDGKYYRIYTMGRIGGGIESISAQDISGDGAPRGYWELTNPDRYVLEAIITGKVVRVPKNATDLTIVEQLREHIWLHNVRYNAKYYRVYINPALIDLNL